MQRGHAVAFGPRSFDWSELILALNPACGVGGAAGAKRVRPPCVTSECEQNEQRANTCPGGSINPGGLEGVAGDWVAMRSVERELGTAAAADEVDDGRFGADCACACAAAP